MNPDILLNIIQLILLGIAAFLAILVMSKTREASWMFLVAGFLLSYCSLIYDFMTKLGVLSVGNIKIAEIPLSTLLQASVPTICFIISFILKLKKKR